MLRRQFFCQNCLPMPVPVPNSKQYEIILLELRISPSQTIDLAHFIEYILINRLKVLQFNWLHLISCNFFGCDCVTHDGDWCFYWDSNEICQPLMHEHCNAFTTMQYFNSWDMNKVVVDTAVKTYNWSILCGHFNPTWDVKSENVCVPGWGDICSRGLGIRQPHPSTVFESRQGPEWLRHSLWVWFRSCLMWINRPNHFCHVILFPKEPLKSNSLLFGILSKLG